MLNQNFSSKSSQVGTKAGEERATFIMKTELLEKIRNVAYWDRLKIKDVIEVALVEYFARYEKKNGEIKTRL
ncbi:hypothetical protein SAMN05444008_11273 [Cnuella takakiae]|uniref:Uncharacterized protein n=1 Tax=Cnuella takakiae TaxID=1302690 RepID=A0A1M5EJU4_9BACT|nr:hypothetical protein [Cnuella takakiae]OLY91199.1 hypothetical protein BUE76_04265 [Cnuella takakiae]SHF79414.1 hypothetical protein SAMN05444008_11273 [Cnuella takakiae]